MIKNKEINIYYDKDCPFCDAYSNYVKLKKITKINLLNVRDEIDKISYFKSKNFDINNGIILEIDSKIYQGAEALLVIDTLLKKENLKDRVLTYIVKTPLFKNIIYPIIKFIRKIVLKMIGKNAKI